MKIQELCAAIEARGAHIVTIRRVHAGAWECNLEVRGGAGQLRAGSFHGVLNAIASWLLSGCGRCGSEVLPGAQLCTSCDNETVILRCDLCDGRTLHAVNSEGFKFVCETCGCGKGRMRERTADA